MRYELTDLRLFLAIAEAGSLSAGAAAVHLTASAASYRLKNLEFALGVPLFTRAARGMELTAAGTSVLKHVRGLFAGIEAMHGEIASFSKGLKGSVRIVANSSSLNGFIVPSLSRFLSAHPTINMVVEERPSTTILAAINDQEADIGILAGPVAATASDVTSRRFALDRLVIATPLDHPLLAHAAVPFAAVLDRDFVCMDKASSNTVFLKEMAHQTGKGLSIRIHVQTFDAVLHMVAAGVGVALVPRSIASAALDAGRIGAVGLTDPWAHRELSLVTRAGDLSPLVSAVVDLLLDDPVVMASRLSKG